METVDGVLDPIELDAGGPLYAGPRYESPFGLEEGLSERDRELCESFARDGFLIIDDLGLEDFDELAATLRSDLEPIHAQGFNRIQDAWTVSTAARQLATAPAVLDTLRVLYGREPIPFQTLHFRRGSQQGTHSDAVHFHSVPRHFMCGVWIALEAVGADNGPLHYYPGSHNRPILEYLDLGLDPSDPKCYARYERLMAKLADSAGLERRTIELEPGKAMIWAAGLWHGGDPINDPESTRRTQVTHYMFDGCVHYAPRLRDLRSGRMGYLHYRDIRTGEWRRPTFGSNKVRVGLNDTARFVGKELAYNVGLRRYMRCYS
jgi:Phytanoyl-CoA dioxygenase (PhyH)